MPNASLDTPPRPPLGPATRVGLTVVFTIALVGLFVGVRPRGSAGPEFDSYTAANQHTNHPGQGPDETAAGMTGVAVLARSNRELLDRPWSTELGGWSPTGEAPPPVSTVDAAAKASAIAARATHRAFDGAPPTIPHPTSQGSAIECLACHENGMRLGNALAPPMSHQRYTQCTQCHVPEVSPVPGLGSGLVVASGFTPRRGAPPAFRWGVGPPQIPHGTHMREQCSACHGVNGRPGLQTRHPQRQSCTQCHVSDAAWDLLRR